MNLYNKNLCIRIFRCKSDEKTRRLNVKLNERKKIGILRQILPLNILLDVKILDNFQPRSGKFSCHVINRRFHK